MIKVDEIKELDALVSLIDEPNEDMFSQIRNKVLAYGNQAIPVLEEAWVNTLGDSDSVRIESLIEDIRINAMISDYSYWKDEQDPKIIDGYLILMKYINPKIDGDEFGLYFEKIFKEIWLELNDNLTALEKIKVINHVLYSVNKVNTISKLPAKSDGFSLNNLTEKQNGNAYLLGTFYISIAQKLNIPVYGVDLPGHFILVYMDDVGKQKNISSYSGEDVMFYINPANAGAVFTHNEVRHYINQMNLKLMPDYFLPTSNVNIISRIIKERITAYKLENNQSKLDGLQSLLAIS
jgi:regulator of sirC expression with transglutaminase-like and TPR domain